MHDFASVQKVMRELNSLEKAPKKVRIKLGKMMGSPRGFEEMFREFTSGTPLEGMGLEIESIPVEISCGCGLEGQVRIQEHVHFVRCPRCGKVADIVKGNELDIEVLE